jgi:hypothetical protein
MDLDTKGKAKVADQFWHRGIGPGRRAAQLLGETLRSCAMIKAPNCGLERLQSGQ